MFAEERQEMIVKILNQEGSVRVKTLSEKFNVTEDSIRKDLTLLEKKGLLKKTYGGAVKKRKIVHQIDVADRKGRDIEAKKEMAKRALSLIKERDTVFLDISTTSIEIAKQLVGISFPLTVVTNMLDVLLILHKSEWVDVICIGGRLHNELEGFVGSVANEQLQNYNFDSAFIGMVGLDLDSNRAYTYFDEDGYTKSAAIANSKKAYMMLEDKKLEDDGSYSFAKTEDFFGVISDGKLSERNKKKLMDKGLTIY